MLGGRLPSLTAMIVAFARGVGRGAPDTEAARMVPAGVGVVLRALHLAAEVAPAVDRGLSVATLGLVDHVTLRTLAIDEVVDRAARDEGARQLVILGAGLDARAHRLASLARSTVFEVDHPATQRYKRRRTGGVEGLAARLVHVGVDFERDDLGERLGASGHDRDAATTWIWEGVTPYLTFAAIEATLEVVARRSSPGSRLAMTYGTPDLGSHGSTLLRPLVMPAFRLLGEPLRGLMSSDEAAALVTRRGFDVDSDEGAGEWAARHGRAPPPMIVAERLLVATLNARARR